MAFCRPHYYENEKVKMRKIRWILFLSLFVITPYVIAIGGWGAARDLYRDIFFRVGVFDVSASTEKGQEFVKQGNERGTF